MERTKLQVRVRDGRGTKDAKALRASGDIPGVIYSATSETQAIAINARDLRHAVTAHGIHSILDVAVDDQPARPVLIKEFQLDPVRDRVIHVDLHEIRLDQKINTAIPVHLEGHAEGVNMGGALSQPTHELHVEALPAALVDAIMVDVSALEIGQSIRLGDIEAPDGHHLHRRPRGHHPRHHRGAGVRGGAQDRGRYRGRAGGGGRSRGSRGGRGRGRRGRRRPGRRREPDRVGGAQGAPAAARLRPVARRARGGARKPRPGVRLDPSQPRVHGHRPAGGASGRRRGAASSRAGWPRPATATCAWRSCSRRRS